MDKQIMQERYQTQMNLKGVGLGGQVRICQAKLLVVGAGGLGCPALLYLCGAGIGTIGIIDPDKVSLRNLHRQVLYRMDDVGRFKVDAAKDALLRLNPEVNIITYNALLSKDNALDIIKAYDLAIDGTDNLAAKYLINDSCVQLGKPFVYGGVDGNEGQIAIFNRDIHAANLRDLFPTAGAEQSLKGAVCQQQGVLGMLPGIIGNMQAVEAIKWICGVGEQLKDYVIVYNMLEQKIYRWQLPHLPENAALFMERFEPKGNRGLHPGKDNSIVQSVSIDCHQFEALRQEIEAVVIDIRSPDEMPRLDGIEHLTLPMGGIERLMLSMPQQYFLLVCQTGKRSQILAEELSAIASTGKKFLSLNGGISQLLPYNKK